MPTLSPNELIKFTPLRTPWPFPDLKRYMKVGIVDFEIQDILNKMDGTLSPELCQMIIDYCNDSPLWRYCAVDAWYSAVAPQVK